MSEKKHFISIGCLYNIPPMSMNCGELSEPKTTMYGGSLRYRLSSQSYSRKAKSDVQSEFEDNEIIDYSSRQHHIIVTDDLVNRGIPVDDASVMAEMVYRYFIHKDFLFKKKKQTKKDIQKTENNEEAEDIKKSGKDIAISMLSVYELRMLADVAQDIYKKYLSDKNNYKDINDFFKKNQPEKDTSSYLDVSLDISKFRGGPLACSFGRFFASRPELVKSATILRSQMITTHAVDMGDNVDYFTAIDDLLGGEDTGYAHGGEKQFANGCFYKCIIIDFSETMDKKHLGGIEEANPKFNANEYLKTIVKSMTLALPTGKKNSYFANVPPSCIILSVVENGDVFSDGGAFEAPVPNTKKGFFKESAVRLIKQHKWSEQYTNFIFSGINIEEKNEELLCGIKAYDDYRILIDDAFDAINKRRKE